MGTKVWTGMGVVLPRKSPFRIMGVKPPTRAQSIQTHLGCLCDDALTESNDFARKLIESVPLSEITVSGLSASIGVRRLAPLIRGKQTIAGVLR